mgnify:CR=1 FL=1
MISYVVVTPVNIAALPEPDPLVVVVTLVSSASPVLTADVPITLVAVSYTHLRAHETS